MTEEAKLQETAAGVEPEDKGWFVVNVRDTAWLVHDAFGAGCVFESRQRTPFPEVGINISVLQPGQPACLYHEEGGAGRLPRARRRLHPASELAARYDASAEAETANPREAYARFERPQPGRPQGWEQLPWVQGG